MNYSIIFTEISFSPETSIFRDIKYIKSQDTATCNTIPAIDESPLFSLDQSRLVMHAFC